ncbi:MAG: SirB2 family protein [Methylococcales bacterium]|nr:SirB2 family protein [Methylococcales bacterium]
MLTFHIVFVALSLTSFIVRVLLIPLKPLWLKTKFFKIAPHIIDTFLLLSGLNLVIQNQWLEGDFNWIIAKFIALLIYIGFGVMVMRMKGITRWLAFIGALSFYGYIIAIAVTKYSFLGLL